MLTIENQKELKKIVLIFFIFLLLVTCSDIFYNYRAIIHKPILASSDSAIVVKIAPNTSARAFVKQLQLLKLIRSSHVLLTVIRSRGLSNHLQAGVYQINPGETVIDLLNRVVKGDVLIEPFRIIEGSNLFDLTSNLAKSPYLNFSAADLASFAKQHLSVEGLFLADTYYYKAGSSALSLLRQANQNLSNYLEFIWQQRDPTLPYKNSYELLVAASIIEKEASLPLERKIIGGIIANRLKLHMPLQMDPTVIYALTVLSQSTPDKMTISETSPLNHQDLRIKSPYNTYSHRGLPPTPIAMVGKQSLDAAAHPEITEYLYFYAKGDGSHQFSKNYLEQQKAINQYKKSQNN